MVTVSQSRRLDFQIGSDKVVGWTVALPKTPFPALSAASTLTIVCKEETYRTW
jgi:hypothetical protein